MANATMTSNRAPPTCFADSFCRALQIYTWVPMHEKGGVNALDRQAVGNLVMRLGLPVPRSRTRERCLACGLST